MIRIRVLIIQDNKTPKLHLTNFEQILRFGVEYQCRNHSASQVSVISRQGVIMLKIKAFIIENNTPMAKLSNWNWQKRKLAVFGSIVSTAVPSWTESVTVSIKNHSASEFSSFSPMHRISSHRCTLPDNPPSIRHYTSVTVARFVSCRLYPRPCSTGILLQSNCASIQASSPLPTSRAPSSLQFRLVRWNWKIEEAAFVRRNSLHRLHTFAAKWLSSRGTFSIKAFAATRRSYGSLRATDSHSKGTTRKKA